MLSCATVVLVAVCCVVLASSIGGCAGTVAGSAACAGSAGVLSPAMCLCDRRGVLDVPRGTLPYEW